jgi:hypothetical protein
MAVLIGVGHFGKSKIRAHASIIEGTAYPILRATISLYAASSGYNC